MNYNILFTCAGRRNYLINYFKEALKGRGKIIAVDSQELATALIDADVSICVPNVNDKNYLKSLVEIVETYSVKAVISLNDFELPILSKNKEIFEKIGAKVIVSNTDVINVAFDKWETHNFIKRIGLNSPKTYINLDQALSDIEKGNLTFPIVLKPRFGSGSLSIEHVEDIEELKLTYQLLSLKLKKSVLQDVQKNTIVNETEFILIQEKLQGKEFGFDVVNDFNGEYFGMFVREKLSMRNGETDKAVSVIDDSFDEVGKLISKSLKHIGTVDGDAFVCNGQIYVLELNPRFGGGYPFSHHAGANISAVYVNWIIDGEDALPFEHINYKPGVIYSKCDRLIKHNL
ncbi:ATP-grasp domain-containing protein [Seonamhaeicola marinus]|uniref:ATP-grasp domain-containing protein n=1 Tax=Seonamhaeicola marinus TaxID=1912246 RepID=A0A5D0HR10_9FLAO|nr:ATP-grasp domain-containing protein [Seonamhaeicola marinus]TYA71822.1 ATP-grasp domain-containing protein [Seonamhaeicola marinus]